jgi:hypothetical protein
MKEWRYVKKPSKLDKDSAHFSRAASVLVMGVIPAVSVFAILLAGAGSSNASAASTNPTLTQVTQKRYKATRAIVVDKQTGQLRLPTKQEVEEVVQSLTTLAKRSSEDLQQTTVASGAVALDLDGGFAGVMLARPKGDGTWETKCVFTLEEGIEFLGIVEDNSPQ